MFSLGQSHFSSPWQNLCLFPNLEILECSKDLFLSLFLLCIYFFNDFNLYRDYMSKYCLYNNSSFGHSSNFLNSSPLGELIGTPKWTCSKPKSLVYLHSLLWRNKSLLLSHSTSLFKLTLSFKNVDHILESSFFVFCFFLFLTSNIQFLYKFYRNFLQHASRIYYCFLLNYYFSQETFISCLYYSIAPTDPLLLSLLFS